MQYFKLNTKTYWLPISVFQEPIIVKFVFRKIDNSITYLTSSHLISQQGAHENFDRTELHLILNQ